MSKEQLLSDYYTQHREGLVRYLTVLTADADQAQDMVQDLFLRLLSGSQLISPQTLPALVHTMARHAAAIEHVLSRTMLDARTVAAYRAYALDGEPAADVATRLGITPNALRQIKFRLDHMIAAVEAAYGE